MTEGRPSQSRDRGRYLIEPISKIHRMTNGNWICLDCRTSVRRPTWRMVIYMRPWILGSTGAEKVKCPNCKESCRFIGPDTEVPPKRDDTAWGNLRDRIRESRARHSDSQSMLDTKKKHKIERRIIELESRPENAERSRLIKDLRDELQALAGTSD